MSAEWTLPLIQQRLDELPIAGNFLLPQADVLRLFGPHGAAEQRIANFARGHGCTVTQCGEDVLFNKAPGDRRRIGDHTDGGPGAPHLEN